jgi:hypothetical protein
MLSPSLSLSVFRSNDRGSGDYAGSISDLNSVTSRLSQVSVSRDAISLCTLRCGRATICFSILSPHRLVELIMSNYYFMNIIKIIIKFIINIEYFIIIFTIMVALITACAVAKQMDFENKLLREKCKSGK